MLLNLFNLRLLDLLIIGLKNINYHLLDLLLFIINLSI